MKETTPRPYADTYEWLESKRQLVGMLQRMFLRRDGNGDQRPAADVDRPVLEAALSWHEKQHEQRLALTRAAGVKLPIDDLVAEFNLDETERDIIETMLVITTDIAREHSWMPMRTSTLVRLVARGRSDLMQSCLQYFVKGSRLQRAAVSCDTHGWETFGTRDVTISDDLVARLLGAVPQEPVKKPASAPPVDDIAEYVAGCGLVLSPTAAESLRAAWGQVRRRSVISDNWGFGSMSQLAGGLCLLFHGPSGTGKTFTARMLCQALGREPLIVSYPDLVSKWVGETEKNTQSAFAEAARSGKVLIFDEADAVFARRTDVRHSTDRYANGAVNTLLMELERSLGIVILTTNHAGVLDPALERRVRYKVFFGVPDAGARVTIWKKHLPQKAPLASDVDLAKLADEYKLTGGQIANAVLTAASLAAARLETDSASGQITMADFEAAASRELDGYS
ncbi:ATP-binding protein, partial [candidate division WOR-3 bacterium]|nr:ATP-binding protein [candidate division WOR-3 bacterium]